jgi:hypothetical protein
MYIILYIKAMNFHEMTRRFHLNVAALFQQLCRNCIRLARRVASGKDFKRKGGIKVSLRAREYQDIITRTPDRFVLRLHSLSVAFFAQRDRPAARRFRFSRNIAMFLIHFGEHCNLLM